ncbi:MAG: hypothetical protein A2X97_07905 [Bdellovibrionales bacterium GWA1_52_35]|nr:MAG: hypothetical protein A2X97_07905 [Bdellovibrionales bacterium GWA1_52_35]
MTQIGSLREQLRALEQVQELDTKIDSVKKNRDALPAALKALDDSRAKISATINTKKNSIVEIEKIQKQARAALDLNKDRLARSTTRLESVQNSQEYSAVNKEIEQLNKMNLTLADQDKKATAEIEQVNKDVADLEVQLGKIQSDRDTQASVVSGQTSQFDDQLKELNHERSAFTVHIEKRILTQYDRVRAARGGIGIVSAVAGRCKGCNMVLPPQLFNMIQKSNELFACPSCNRILFFPTTQQEQNKASEANPA